MSGPWGGGTSVSSAGALSAIERESGVCSVMGRARNGPNLTWPHSAGAHAALPMHRARAAARWRLGAN